MAARRRRSRRPTDTFSGIAPGGIPAFIVAQLLGAFAATLLFRWMAIEAPSKER